MLFTSNVHFLFNRGLYGIRGIIAVL